MNWIDVDVIHLINITTRMAGFFKQIMLSVVDFSGTGLQDLTTYPIYHDDKIVLPHTLYVYRLL